MLRAKRKRDAKEAKEARGAKGAAQAAAVAGDGDGSGGADDGDSLATPAHNGKDDAYEQLMSALTRDGENLLVFPFAEPYLRAQALFIAAAARLRHACGLDEDGTPTVDAPELPPLEIAPAAAPAAAAGEGAQGKGSAAPSAKPSALPSAAASRLPSAVPSAAASVAGTHSLGADPDAGSGEWQVRRRLIPCNYMAPLCPYRTPIGPMSDLYSTPIRPQSDPYPHLSDPYPTPV